MFLEELAPLILFIFFAVFTFLLPFLKQRQRIKRYGEMKDKGAAKPLSEKRKASEELQLELERERMRENLLKKKKQQESREKPAENREIDSLNGDPDGSYGRGAKSYWEGKSRKVTHAEPFHERISSLSPLQQAVVLSEILGTPRAFKY